MITNEMTNILIDIYNKYRIADPNRKIVKVVVDSVLEQLSKRYFSSKIGGIMNMRREINRVIENYDGRDKELLGAMKNVLMEYDKVFTKRYTKNDGVLLDFLDNELKTLVSLMINIELFNDEDLAFNLRELL